MISPSRRAIQKTIDGPCSVAFARRSDPGLVVFFVLMMLHSTPVGVSDRYHLLA